MIKGVQLES